VEYGESLFGWWTQWKLSPKSLTLFLNIH